MVALPGGATPTYQACSTGTDFETQAGITRGTSFSCLKQEKSPASRSPRRIHPMTQYR